MQEITLETIFNTLLQFKEETNAHFKKIDEHLERVDKRFEEVYGCFEEIDEHFNKSDSRLDSLERTVAKIEFEHGEKLAFLCDNAKINNEKHEEFEKE